MKKFPEVKLVALDLDGVLIDSYPLMKTSWEKSMDNFSLNIPFSEFDKNIGLSIEMILKKVIKNKEKYDIKEIAKYYKKTAIRSINKINTFSEIEFFLDYLSSEYKLAILTSKTSERVYKIIEKHFNRINFESILCSDHLKESKPNPEGLNKLLKDHSLDSGELAYIGDTIFDQSAAENANCIFGYASWGYGDVDIYDFRIDTPKEIKKFF